MKISSMPIYLGLEVTLTFASCDVKQNSLLNLLPTFYYLYPTHFKNHKCFCANFTDRSK